VTGKLPASGEDEEQTEVIRPPLKLREFVDAGIMHEATLKPIE